MSFEVFKYCIYGLSIKTNIEIPWLLPCVIAGEGEIDVTVTMGSFSEEISDLIAQSDRCYYFEEGYSKTDPPHLVVNSLADERFFHFRYGAGVQFVCDRKGTVVYGCWEDYLSFTDASLYLLGPILGFLLRLRGVTCLHASSVVVDGHALAIVGVSGSGKSSLAAAFAAVGYPILTDDILALKFEEEQLFALPGHTRLRLLPNSYKNIAGLPDNLPPLAPNWDKCYLDLAAATYSFQSQAVPLDSIYLLDWGHGNLDAPEIVPMNAASAVPFLAGNTYRNELLDSEMRAEEFHFLSRVVSKIPVKKLRPLDSILEISGLLTLVQEDFGAFISR